jgi:hypothetical protein
MISITPRRTSVEVVREHIAEVSGAVNVFTRGKADVIDSRWHTRSRSIKA